MEIISEIEVIEQSNAGFDFNVKNEIKSAIDFIDKDDKIDEDDKELYKYDSIAKMCATNIAKDPEFGRISVKYELLKIKKIVGFTGNNYLELIEKQYNNEIISENYYNFMKTNHQVFDLIDESRDSKLDIFGLKTLERSYLLRENQEIKEMIKEENESVRLNSMKDDEKYNKYNKYYNFKELEKESEENGNKIQSRKEKNKKLDQGKIYFLEVPQMLWLRTAVQIHGINGYENSIEDKIKKIKITYDLLSNLYMTHATPTLFNSGRRYPQLSSCYLFDCEDDLFDIGDNFSKMMQISKYGGGIGINLSKIRGTGSLIRSNGGNASGIVPLCKVLDKIANYANQSGLRKGSIACYLEIWHNDVFEFIELRTNKGSETMKARDLFYGLWTCDLFMNCVINNDYWYLMTPNISKGLNDVYGEEFNKLYYHYVLTGQFTKKIKATELMEKIIECQMETGMPYVLYKDHINNKSNQMNIGIIKSSNLCTEIVEHTSQDETAVCNLASLSLPKYVNEDKTFNYEELGKVVKIVVENLNIIIDSNFYPTNETFNSNNKHRPVGLGVQGLADTYIKMGLNFESMEAMVVNKKIFECIYYNSLLSSNNLAKKYKHYSSFIGSPFSKGILQFHMWGKSLEDMNKELNYDWTSLIEDIKKYGTINSLITSLMPTASTSQIMCNNESIEPYASNVYVRTTLSGPFIVINKNLIEDLKKINLWTKRNYTKLLFYEGSVQKLDVPNDIKNRYKTATEIKQSVIIQQSADRGVFIDQTQSMNLFIAESNSNKVFSCLIRGWKLGLKTGIYYLRSKPATSGEKYTIDIEEVNEILNEEKEKEKLLNQKNNSEECFMCSA